MSSSNTRKGFRLDRQIWPQKNLMGLPPMPLSEVVLAIVEMQV
ncbi:hypothetical protein [Pseudovibrio ascidiaceicola]|nr:hypothetical protein [Pseudovibrio ascidiaceicola]